MADDRNFKHRLREAAPAPYDETEAYKRFNNLFSIITLFFMIFCAYLAAFLPLGEAEASKIFTYLPLLNDRALWLKEYHYPSYLTFAAMVGSLIVTMPLMVVVFIWGYWKTVVVPFGERAIWLGSLAIAVPLSSSSGGAD
ncbi:MAG: hypothetical protein U5K75_04590 [Ahrensia sp.]|nr:hypothetical protein [Ahrensia sp.]